MLRSVFTPNRTVCNRVPDETRHNQRPFAGLRGLGRSTCRPALRRNNHAERLRRSLVVGLERILQAGCGSMKEDARTAIDAKCLYVCVLESAAMTICFRNLAGR